MSGNSPRNDFLKNTKKGVDKSEQLRYNTPCSEGTTPNAGVAHPVERHLAKVEVASSSLVTRSRKKQDIRWMSCFFSMK